MNSNWHFNSHPLHKHTVDAHRRWVTVVYQEHNWEYSVTYALARARACVVTCKTRMFIFCFSNSAAAAEQTLCSNGIRKQGACKPIELCKAWLCLSLCGCVCCSFATAWICTQKGVSKRVCFTTRVALVQRWKWDRFHSDRLPSAYLM